MVGIVFYSRTGSTREYAKGIKEATGGEIIELLERNPKKTNGQCAIQAIFGVCPPLENQNLDLAPYDLVVLLTPIYAFNPSPAINSFFKIANLKGKKVYLVTLGEDPKSHGKAIEKIKRKVEKKGGTFLGVSSFRGASMFKRTFYFTEEELRKNSEEISRKLS
ncbi:MAG: flavodoxin family protein [bacterium]